MQREKASITRVVNLRAHQLPKEKLKQSNKIIHVTIGLSRCSTNAKNTSHEQVSGELNHPEKESEASILPSLIKWEDRPMNCFIIKKAHPSLSQKKTNGNSTTQDFNIDTSSEKNSSILKASKVTPHQNVSIIHACSDEKGMTNESHGKTKTNKKAKCSRRCVIITSLAILIAILIVTGILLGVFIKPKSSTTRTETPVLRWKTTAIIVAGVANISGNGNNQLNSPTDAKLDYKNNLYIADYSNHRIQKYSVGALTGQTVAGNGTPGSSPYQLNCPTRMIIDSNENLYILDALNYRIQFWAKGAIFGTTIARTGSLGSNSTQFNISYDMALDPASGTLYVLDYNNQRIVSYPSGVNSSTLVFGGNGRGTNNTQLYDPTGLYFDPFSNSLLITNYYANNIVRYVLGATSWTLIAGDINGTLGMTSTTFDGPISVTSDPMGNIYVADRVNQRVQFSFASFPS